MLRRAPLAAAVAVAVGLAPASARAQSRDEVARHYAPTIYQEAGPDRPRHDLVTSFDYDCNWSGDDNRENIESHSLPALVYYAATETDTHWFVHYLPYHPTDDKVTNGHEHDTESILLVVRKTGIPFGLLEVMETRFHTVWYQYARPMAGIANAGDNVDGPIHFDTDGVRPAVYQQAIGHGICGGFAPPCLFIDDYCDLAITCSHGDAPHLNRRGVIYRYDGTSAEPPAPGSRDMFTAGYDLVNIESTLWAHRTEIGPGRVYERAIDYNGSRCGAGTGLICPRGFGGNFEGDDGSSPGAMWAQEGGNPSLPDGEVFFDPAYAMSRRLSFPAPFSLTYAFDPYVGIGSLEPAEAGTVCDARSDAGADAGDATDAGADVGADTGEFDIVLVDASADVEDTGFADGLDDAVEIAARDVMLDDAIAIDAASLDAGTDDVATDGAARDVVAEIADGTPGADARRDAGTGGMRGGCGCRAGVRDEGRGTPRLAIGLFAMGAIVLGRRRSLRTRTRSLAGR